MHEFNVCVYLMIVCQLASKDLKYLGIPVYVETTVTEPKPGMV